VDAIWGAEGEDGGLGPSVVAVYEDLSGGEEGGTRHGDLWKVGLSGWGMRGGVLGSGLKMRCRGAVTSCKGQ